MPEAAGASARQHAAPSAGPFAWLIAAPAPSGWKKLTLPSREAVMWYPPSLSAGKSDPGTATALEKNAKGVVIAYLNATPKQGNEGLGNFASFRLAHVRAEVALSITELAHASNLKFRGGTGTCVIDVYVTKSHTSFREIACFVKGKGAGTVIIAAAPPADWATSGPLLERAVAAFQVR